MLVVLRPIRVFFLTICGRTAAGIAGATFMLTMLVWSWASDAGNAVVWCVGWRKKSDYELVMIVMVHGAV